jgi:hypothetical protein
MFWIAQVVIVSFVIIFLLHNLYYFFKETLTIPKMKDMVKRPQQKYDALFRELEESKTANAMNAINDENDAASMKNELKRYMMELNAPQSAQPQSAQPQSAQSQPQQPEPQQLHSNFIEIGSIYQ